MASAMRSLAQKTPELIVKSAKPEAWETTAKLREQFVATTLDAMPARMAAARAEYNAVKDKILSRSVTVNDVAIGASRAAEFYMFYLVGRVVGRRQVSP